MTQRTICAALALAMASAAGSAALAQHVTDGAFTSGSEWDTNRPTIGGGSFGFNGGTNRGGAVLYVEQSSTGGQGGLNRLGDVLSLMYDYTSSPTALPGTDASNGSVDIFFEVPSDADYVIHITQSGFLAFEKPHDGNPSPSNPDGSLHFMNPDNSPFGPWSALDQDDLDNADFHTGLTFGPSPNSGVPHLIAEFDLTIANPNDPVGQGLYSPDPSFWSGSGKHGTTDPPFSSEIFTLQEDGSILTSMVLNAFGDPVAQPSDVPEPTSVLAGTALAGLLMARVRRK